VVSSTTLLTEWIASDVRLAGTNPMRVSIHAMLAHLASTLGIPTIPNVNRVIKGNTTTKLNAPLVFCAQLACFKNNLDLCLADNAQSGSIPIILAQLIA
jgi:hypothetical protein